MSHSLEVSDSTFKRLQELAVPLVDTTESVIIRLLDAYDSKGIIRPPTPEPLGVPTDFNPLAPPNFTHSRLDHAVFGEVELPRPKWNTLVEEAIRQAVNHLQDFDRLRSISMVNVCRGKFEDRGFRHIQDIDISFQGQDANDAYRSIVEIAGKIGRSFHIEFHWLDKGEAAYPGQKGKIDHLVEKDDEAQQTEPGSVSHQPANEHDVTWRDDIVEALRQLGGSASLGQIYVRVKNIRLSAGRSLPRTWESVVRGRLEAHSTDSDAYEGRSDIFFMPKGRGAGFWALRGDYGSKPDSSPD